MPTSRFLRTVFACFAVLLLLGPAHAVDWKSPDGGFAVTVPDPPRFVAVDRQFALDALSVWRSDDGSLEFAVFEAPLQLDIEDHDLVRLEAFRDGFLDSFRKSVPNPRLLHSAAEWHNGHTVYVLAARGDQDGIAISRSTISAIVGKKVYQASVVGAGKDTQTDPDAKQFIASFKILVPYQPPTIQQTQPSNQPRPSDDEVAARNVSYRMGQIAGSVLFVALLLYLVRRFGGGQSTQSRGGGRKSVRGDEYDDDEDDDRPRRPRAPR